MPGKKHVRGVGAKEQREYEHILESAQRSGRYGSRHFDLLLGDLVRNHKTPNEFHAVAKMRAFYLLGNFIIIAALLVIVPSCEPNNGRPSVPRLTFTATPVRGSFPEGEKVVLRFEINNAGES